jgi:hypothetical protein
MKFPTKTTDGKWINWNEAPKYDPYYVSSKDVEIEWNNFKKKYKLPDNIEHPYDQGWYVEPDTASGMRGPSISLLANQETAKLYDEVLDLEGIVDDKMPGDEGLDDNHKPYYDFHIYDTESETYLGVLGLGGDRFKVDITCRNLPGYNIAPITVSAKQFKEFLDELYEEGHKAINSWNGFKLEYSPSSGKSTWAGEGSGYSKDWYKKTTDWPNDWHEKDEYQVKDAFNKLNGKYNESLSEAYTVKFGYATEERKPETFNTLEDAVKFINDGIKKKDAEHFVLVDADGKEMIWLDHYKDSNDHDVGYTVSRHDDKKTIEFDKSKGLSIKQEEVKEEDNKAMRDIIVSELFKIKGYSAAQLVHTFRFVDSKKEPTKVDFENKIVYYDDYAKRPDIAKDVLTQYKSKNESLAESWYKQIW